jgi:hypothetical protein
MSKLLIVCGTELLGLGRFGLKVVYDNVFSGFHLEPVPELYFAEVGSSQCDTKFILVNCR